jgi:hypothetical protein
MTDEGQALDTIAKTATDLAKKMMQEKKEKAAKKKAATPKKDSNAVELINIGQSNYEIFPDEHGIAFAYAKNPGEAIPLQSRRFRGLLVQEFYRVHHEAVGGDAVNSALSVLEADAMDAPRHGLSVRSVMEGDTIYVDLGESMAVITKDGWKVQPYTGPRFRTYKHMLPMEISTYGSNEELREFVKSFYLKEEGDAQCAVAQIGTTYVDIPHPILLLWGDQGGLKSTFMRATRAIIDPSSVPDVRLPNHQDQLIQILAHNGFPCFDNCSEIQDWQADDLCRASTGAGMSKRMLYTDDDDFPYHFRWSIAMNGINWPTTRPDFVQRVNHIEFTQVSEANRREDKEVAAKVAEAVPRLRKVVLDALVIMLQTVGAVREAHKAARPRMADFAVYGEAFCRAVGYAPESFFTRYMLKQVEGSEVALDNNVVAQLILELFGSQSARLKTLNEFKGTSSQLLAILKDINYSVHFCDDRALPESPEGLARQLNRIKIDLKKISGISFQRAPAGGIRWIRLAKDVPTLDNPSPTPQIPKDGLCEYCGKSGPIVLDKEHRYACGKCLKDNEAGRDPSKAEVQEIVCSVEGCGVRLGASGPGSELSIYKVGKKRFCKKHFEEAKARREGKEGQAE